MNKYQKFIATSALLISLGLPSFGLASTLVIKNDDTASIDLIVEPGQGSITGSKHQIKNVIKPHQEKRIEVNRDNLGNADIFSVTGKVKMPSLYNKCSGLFMDQDYKLVFVGSATGGTICYAETLDKSNK